jgi:hypothetical protein
MPRSVSTNRILRCVKLSVVKASACLLIFLFGREHVETLNRLEEELILPLTLETLRCSNNRNIKSMIGAESYRDREQVETLKISKAELQSSPRLSSRLQRLSFLCAFGGWSASPRSASVLRSTIDVIHMWCDSVPFISITMACFKVHDKFLFVFSF